MGTGSMVRSEISSDFLCLRLQRLRTSSDTVSKAVTNKEKWGVTQKNQTTIPKNRGTANCPHIRKSTQNESRRVAYQPDRPRSGCWPQTYHISDVCWWEPTVYAGSLLSVLRWWLMGVCSLETQQQSGTLTENVLDTCLYNHCTNKGLICWITAFDCLSGFAAALPFSRWPTSAKLKLALKLRPTKWSICLQCHSKGRRISMNTSSGLWSELREEEKEVNEEGVLGHFVWGFNNC